MSVRTRRTPGAHSPSPSGRATLYAVGLGVLLVGIPFVSRALGVYEKVHHWGKLVHGIEGLLAVLLVGTLFLAWRDRETVALNNQLATLMTMFFGVLFGIAWELTEFVLDWVFSGDIQKSNTDTTTDLLWNDVGAVLGALLAVHLYCRWLQARQREELGARAAWLVDGPSRLLDKHGFLITIVVAVVAVVAVAALWFADRPVPGFPIA
jgi:uncharacterized membrane protein HdeD (DUF308 family)